MQRYINFIYKGEIMILLSLLFSFITYADNNMGPIRASFPTLIEMYKKGSYVNLVEITGYYSGRCFSLGKPTTAMASLLGVTKSPKKIVYPVVAPFLQADSFDHSNLKDSAYFHNIMCEEDKCDQGFELKSEGEPLTVVYDKANQLSIQKFSNYLVLKATYVGEKDIDVAFANGDQLVLKKGMDYFSCYYFKKIEEKK